MVTEFTAAIGIGSAHFVDGGASNRGSADSSVAITVTTIVVYCAHFANFSASVSNGAQELKNINNC